MTGNRHGLCDCDAQLGITEFLMCDACYQEALEIEDSECEWFAE